MQAIKGADNENEQLVYDPVSHPQHYNRGVASCERCAQPIECITIVRTLSFNLGNAIKYIWRHSDKNGVQDLKKAVWYLNDQIRLMQGLPYDDQANR